MRSTCSISLYIVAQSETSDGFWNGFPISVVHYLSTYLKITLRNVPEFLRLSFSLRCFYARWMPVKEGIDICSQHHHTAHFALVTQQLSFKPLTIAHHVFLSIFPSSFLLNITQLPALAQSLSPSTPNKRLLNYFFNTRQAKAQVPFCLKEKVFPQRIRNGTYLLFISCYQTSKANMCAHHSSSSALKQANLIWTPLSPLPRSTDWLRAFMWQTPKWVFLSFHRFLFSSSCNEYVRWPALNVI